MANLKTYPNLKWMDLCLKNNEDPWNNCGCAFNGHGGFVVKDFPRTTFYVDFSDKSKDKHNLTEGDTVVGTATRNKYEDKNALKKTDEWTIEIDETLVKNNDFFNEADMLQFTFDIMSSEENKKRACEMLDLMLEEIKQKAANL